MDDRPLIGNYLPELSVAPAVNLFSHCYASTQGPLEKSHPIDQHFFLSTNPYGLILS